MLRTLLIRSGLVGALAALAALAWWAQSYVRPEAVRTLVLDSFRDQFPGSEVNVGEAHLRVFGGIRVRDLSLARGGDGEPFFAAPAAVIAHDKEALASGRMVIRKIELEQTVLKIERRADGRWTFDGLTRPSPADRPLPMFVVSHGTIVLTDKSNGGLPPLTFSDASLTLVNDPPPLHLNITGSALLSADLPGLPPIRVELTGRLHRLTGAFQFRIHAPSVALDPECAKLVRLWQPSLADYLTCFRATASLRAEIAYRPDTAQPFTYDLELRVREGEFSDPRLPMPLNNMEATIRFRDGRIIVEKAAAKFGTSRAELSLESRPLAGTEPSPPAATSRTPAILASSVKKQAAAMDPLSAFEQHLEKVNLAIRDLPLTDALFQKIGGTLARMKTRFDPTGVVTVNYRFSRPVGGWCREFHVKPQRFGFVYEKFRYPLADVVGSLRQTLTHAGPEEIHVDLTGTAGGQRVDIKGHVIGDGPDPAIHLRISGTNLPIDDRLFEALPRLKHQQALKKLRARGRADFDAEIRQEQNVNLTDSVFRVRVHDARFSHEQFAYPLEGVSGQLTVSVAASDPERPVKPGMREAPDTDRIVLSDFTGRHGNGVVKLKGVHARIPDQPDGKLTLNVTGQDCPLDEDMKAALAGLKLDAVWRTFAPRGTMTFAVDVDVIDRVAAVPEPLPPPFNPHTPPGLRGTLTARPKLRPAETSDPPFNPVTDLKLTLHLTGPSIMPDFFPYLLDEVSGRVRYDGTQVKVEKFTARHGPSLWALEAGEVRFFEDGRVWSNIGRIDVTPLTIDEAFLTALPPGLKKAAREINLRGHAALTMNHLVVLTPPSAPAGPIALQTGGEAQVSASGMNGVVTASAAAVPPAAPGLDPEIYWSGEVKLLGATLDAGIVWDKVMGRIASTGRYYGTHLGEVVGNIWLDEALAADHPIHNVKLSYRADPQTPDPMNTGQYEPIAIRFPDMVGQFFGGAITGEARVVLSDPPRYRLRLDATDVNLAELAHHHKLGEKSRIDGTAQASLRLETASTGPSAQPILDGAGTFDIDNGQMFNLPFLLPLLKTLKLQAPEKTAFEEAHAQFTIRGNRIAVTHLDLLGDAVSIGGSGELDMSGQDVKFGCHVIWSQTLHRWMTTPFGDLSAFLSEKLFRIEVTRGADGQLKYDARLVPFVTDPVRAIADRMKRRSEARAQR